MEQRLSLVTLGVTDVAKSRRFYEKLGWKAGKPSNESVVFFQTGGMIVALWGRAELAKDARVKPGKPGSVSLAYNARSRAEVDRVFKQAAKAGAKVLKPAEKVFWGGYSGYFADPDGHLWEVAWNPGFKLAKNGAIKLPR